VKTVYKKININIFIELIEGQTNTQKNDQIYWNQFVNETRTCKCRWTFT